VSNILEGEYRIISANNGKVGVEKARLFLPDIIISDIMMPEKNGIDLVKELKSNIDTCHIPIILLTALTSVDNKIESFESGADDYIEKPFNSEILKARIKNIFSSREAMQQFFTGQIANGLSVNMSDTPDQKLLAKAIHFVEKNITDEQLSIDILASHLRISRTTLHRKLKVLTNKTTSDFIRTIRLEYAARLLKEGRHNVDEVSFMAGFNSHSYLTRTFKEHFGKTPSDFLAMHQQQKQSFKS
jgi:YesN/AraC family two-component response regulator